jgi:hypothetical protein
MAMEIQTLRGSFAQFSKDLLIRVSDGNTTLDTYIDHKELRAFAAMLVDIADDALSKIGEEAQDCQSKLRDCLEDLQSGDWKAPLVEPVPQGPSETAWALAQLLDGVQRHDLPNMTGLSDSDCDRIWAARPATTGEQQ